MFPVTYVEFLSEEMAQNLEVEQQAAKVNVVSEQKVTFLTILSSLVTLFILS
jgi:hypothetical protein